MINSVLAIEIISQGNASTVFARSLLPGFLKTPGWGMFLTREITFNDGAGRLLRRPERSCAATGLLYPPSDGGFWPCTYWRNKPGKCSVI